MATTCLLCWGSVHQRKNGLCQHLYLRESCPTALTLMPDNSLSPCMFLVPFKCCSHAGAQREWVQVSLCIGPLRGVAWYLRRLHLLQPQYSWDFITGSYGDFSSCLWNCGLEDLVCGWDSLLFRGDLHSQDISLDFHPLFFGHWYHVKIDIFSFKLITSIYRGGQK